VYVRVYEFLHVADGAAQIFLFAPIFWGLMVTPNVCLCLCVCECVFTHINVYD